MDLLKLESCRREREGTKELVCCREAKGSEARARLQRKNSSSTTGGKRTQASAAFPFGAKSPIPHPGQGEGCFSLTAWRGRAPTAGVMCRRMFSIV